MPSLGLVLCGWGCGDCGWQGGPRLTEQSDMFPSAAIVEGGDLYRRCQGRHLALGIVGLNPFRSWFQGGSRQPGVGLTAQNVGQVRSHLIHPSVCVGDPDPVLRCIVSGFFANAARFHSTGAYR